MKVKKGMASSSSFDMILPKSRKGMVLRKLASRRPVAMPKAAKAMPTEASEKATG